MQTCPQCNATLRDTERYCSNCGACLSAPASQTLAHNVINRSTIRQTTVESIVVHGQLKPDDLVACVICGCMMDKPPWRCPGCGSYVCNVHYLPGVGLCQRCHVKLQNDAPQHGRSAGQPLVGDRDDRPCKSGRKPVVGEQASDSAITPFWLAAYLMAIAVVAVGAGVLLYQHGLGGSGPAWRLLPWLWGGEVLVYSVVLTLRRGRVVPLRRAMTGVGFAVVARAVLAFYTANAMSLADPFAHTTALFGQVYAGRWAVVLPHILLMVLYLWLIRPALEAKTPKVSAGRPRRHTPENRV